MLTQKSTMVTKGFLLLLFVSLLSVWADATKLASAAHVHSLNRSSFPHGFLFGTASSAYQYEGGACEGGRGPSIWDTYTHKFPEKIGNHSNGDVAVDSYHRYKEDVRIMKNMNLDAYRFSISWSRILPNGRKSGGINKEGITYYNNLINELLANGIQPFVTLFHWDLPQALEDEYGGFFSPNVADDFRDYAEICFQEFGDRVKHWMTLNEPLTYSANKIGYPVGVCSRRQTSVCNNDNFATQPYIVGHNQLLAHAAAAKLYKDKYQAKQKGLIGIAVNSNWFVPFSDATENKNAAQRAVDFNLGWFVDPLASGDYPHSMRSLVNERLPRFSKQQSEMLKGSFDFIGLNYYTSTYVADVPSSNGGNYTTDSRTKQSAERNGIPIGTKSASDWLYVYPRGLKDLLVYIKKKYNNPLIYITENGISEANNATSLQEALADHARIDYYYRHLSFVRNAIRRGVNLKGYFAWSLLDNFEWADGYSVRFGINYVDFKDGLKRHPKLSARWFSGFLRR